MSRTTANLLLLLAGAIWGMGFIAQQEAMDDIGPMLFIAARFLLGGLCVVPFALAEMRRQERSFVSLFQKHTAWGFLAVGVAFFFGMAFQQVGLIETTVTNAGFLTALYTVFTPLIMIGVLKIKQPPMVFLAAGLALLGIFLLSGGDLGTLTRGDLLIIVCALFWACHVVLTGRVGKYTDLPVTMACTQFFITAGLAFAAFAGGFLIGFGEAIPRLDAFWNAMPEIIYAGTIAGGLGFTLQAVGQRYTSESAAAVLISTESLFAALFGAVFLDERLVPVAYLGCGLIFSAILLVELMPRSKKKPRSQPERS